MVTIGNTFKFFPGDVSWKLDATIYKDRTVLRFVFENKGIDLHIERNHIQRYFYFDGMGTGLLPPEYRDSILAIELGKNSADTAYNLICRLENSK